MKKFDVDKAKEGAEVVTAKGVAAKILLYDRNSRNFPIVAIIDNRKVFCYTSEGKYYLDKDSDFDLKLK